MKIYNAIVIEHQLIPNLAFTGVYWSVADAVLALRDIMNQHKREFSNDIVDYEDLTIRDPSDDDYRWDGYIIELKLNASNVVMTATDIDFAIKNELVKNPKLKGRK